MVEQAVAPLLATLKTSPNDFNTIVQLANLYFDGQQYPEAVKYYRLALKSQPTNADLLTDLGTSIWYMGDADGAIAAGTIDGGASGAGAMGAAARQL